MMHIYKADITGHEVQPNGKIAYKVEVVDESTSKVKITMLRYSQFKDIHDELEQVVNKLKLHIQMPEFPGRKLFGSTNKSEEAVLERKKGLVQVIYIQTIVLEPITTNRKTNHSRNHEEILHSRSSNPS